MYCHSFYMSMKKIVLDGKYLCNRDVAHTYLQEALELPDYYGKNLDALYDLLTSLPETVEIDLAYKDQMLEQLGAYSTSLLLTLQQAEEDAPNLILNIL